ncbi:YraN family protein [Oscillospiraceae bacterium OttesenSCG-928-G22]|nr:YraN family protein [Oscillospiraceae bacterium OttesenSCG-928-G22]
MTKEDGRAGERAALTWYEGRGFRLLAENFHSRYGEIDLIVEDGETLVFCEVKTRRSDRYARPSEHVDAKKQQKILLTAETWLEKHPTELQPRFDVMEVFFTSGRAEIVHIENAFTGEEG